MTCHTRNQLIKPHYMVGIRKDNTKCFDYWYKYTNQLLAQELSKRLTQMLFCNHFQIPINSTSMLQGNIHFYVFPISVQTRKVRIPATYCYIYTFFFMQYFLKVYFKKK